MLDTEILLKNRVEVGNEYKSYGSISRYVVNTKTKTILSNDLSIIYLGIKRDTLKEFGEKNEGGIYKHKKWNDYRGKIDKLTQEKFNQKSIYERYQLSVFPLQGIEPISREDFIKHICEEMVKTYTKKHKGTIGYVSPKAYEKEVEELMSCLLEEHLLQKAEIEATIEKEKKFVTITHQ